MRGGWFIGIQAVCFVLALGLHKSYGGSGHLRKCYSCDGCNDPFNAKANGVRQINCTGSCLKVKGKLSGLSHVVRGCGVYSEANVCQQIKIEGAEKDECLCNKDLCNAATVKKIEQTTFLAVGVAVLLCGKQFIFE